MTFFPTVLAIGLGATIGASMRYYLTQLMNATFGNAFPYGTLSANVIGSFVAGILVVVILEKAALNETYRLMLLIGLTGSLTTMSTLSWESVEMISLGHYGQASINILFNILLSLLAAGLGVVLARYLFSN
ncbi:Fluoride ion transporter CrcB [Bathymodiolus thermophilus thioautotrophic gill symbiont]|jgi:CrcB protein|uniref:Fluoride-specific ion channel FluC n=3 Tax=sulfur-oxidizing symbionts TaxID=32036 RepID=A0A1H6JQS4_9GAMM|nr:MULTISPECIES: fluoride efflux transporter CrcB [sulfur-oxidizing symbionts]CAC5828975.1 CrcB protein [uncultured Gammaproteobacteria bacterium]CAB5503729.1 Fluoride ion transporter CrcB [Bathymodiolus azoricus thioautotrophic gill symbiont]CAB5506026.1 Fluoride ion transporter CrcB [Bathymodiolus thermophilus thioautotrophic gill symbiont]CAC9489495.1 Fluoride ion transporter CrcB [uncultured Gammaproteobacteria bacterium]CAC9502459.1 CrcB protein [uncultured Gammaproteobacteria bacterium]